MLDKVDTFPTLSKKAYKNSRRYLRQRLYSLERSAHEAKIPTMVIFEGWDAVGRSETIQEVTRRLDPRGYKVYDIVPPRTLEMKRPRMWRFWTKLPSYGRLAIFHQSWYGQALSEQVENSKGAYNWPRTYREFNNFERILANDGMTFIKIWLHIPPEEQLRRFIQRTNNPETAWLVTAKEWERHRLYPTFVSVASEMVNQTNTSYAPWTIVESMNQNYRVHMVFRTIINALELALHLEPTEWPTLSELEAEASRKKSKKKKKKDKEKS